METAQHQAPTQGTDKTSASASALAKHVRKCLVTGVELQKSAMIRFVIAPDQTVVPDLAQNLPGRGLWVTASHDAITTAAKKNLFAKAAKEAAKPSPELADQTAALMRARCLSLLGLAKGAGIATLGQMQVEHELRAKKISVLFAAGDAGRDFEKFTTLLDKVTLSRLFSRDELGAALGYDQLVYVGLAGHQLTTRIRDTLKIYTQLLRISNPTPSDTETDA